MNHALMRRPARTIWRNEQDVLLVSLLTEHRDLLRSAPLHPGGRVQKRFWDLIAHELTARYHVVRNARQCKDRFKLLHTRGTRNMHNGVDPQTGVDALCLDLTRLFYLDSRNNIALADSPDCDVPAEAAPSAATENADDAAAPSTATAAAAAPVSSSASSAAAGAGAGRPGSNRSGSGVSVVIGGPAQPGPGPLHSLAHSHDMGAAAATASPMPMSDMREPSPITSDDGQPAMPLLAPSSAAVPASLAPFAPDYTDPQIQLLMDQVLTLDRQVADLYARIDDLARSMDERLGPRTSLPAHDPEGPKPAAPGPSHPAAPAPAPPRRSPRDDPVARAFFAQSPPLAPLAPLASVPLSHTSPNPASHPHAHPHALPPAFRPAFPPPMPDSAPDTPPPQGPYRPLGQPDARSSSRGRGRSSR